MAGSKNGTGKITMWIASGLGVALVSVVSVVWAGASEDRAEHRATLKDHGERIRANEIIGDAIRDDLIEIKDAVKAIDKKVDRVLERVR